MQKNWCHIWPASSSSSYRSKTKLPQFAFIVHLCSGAHNIAVPLQHTHMNKVLKHTHSLTLGNYLQSIPIQSHPGQLSPINFISDWHLSRPLSVSLSWCMHVRTVMNVSRSQLQFCLLRFNLSSSTATAAAAASVGGNFPSSSLKTSHAHVLF
jgi:hypothetical protein